MQVLKESVREAIIESAITEFFQKNYQDANMRDIATKANITVGNIYRYYKNKKELFNTILQPAERAIDKLAEVDTDKTKLSVDTKNDLENLINFVMDTINPYTKEIFIMIFNSYGTHHEKIKNRLEELILIKVSKYYPGKFTRSFLEVISKSFVEAIFIVFKNNIDNPYKIKIMLSDLVVFFFRNLDDRML
ncbi:MAG: TetR/AcrR family transcriptional regulator [Candidatus Izemoplasmatales bacterium]